MYKRSLNSKKYWLLLYFVTISLAILSRITRHSCERLSTCFFLLLLLFAFIDVVGMIFYMYIKYYYSCYNNEKCNKPKLTTKSLFFRNLLNGFIGINISVIVSIFSIIFAIQNKSDGGIGHYSERIGRLIFDLSSLYKISNSGWSASHITVSLGITILLVIVYFNYCLIHGYVAISLSDILSKKIHQINGMIGAVIIHIVLFVIQQALTTSIVYFVAKTKYSMIVQDDEGIFLKDRANSEILNSYIFYTAITVICILTILAIIYSIISYFLLKKHSESISEE